MEVEPSSLPASDGRRAWLGPVLVVGLGLLAYRTLLQGALAAEPAVENWLFLPSQLPPLFVVGVAGWILWERRARLRSLPDRRAPALGFLLAAFGAGLFAWAFYTRTAHLLLPSLAANVLAFAAAYRGRAGCRVALLASLLLLLGSGMPAPLQDELVWRLQQWTASCAGWLLDTLGVESVHSGVILQSPAHTFQVIDACSGMNGIAILLLVSLIVRELFGGGARQAWVVALAPGLGFALNVVRIAYVAASPNPEALAGVEGDHTPQGLTVLGVGTALLYGLGWRLASGRGAVERTPGLDAATSPHGPPWRSAAAVLAALAALTWALPPYEPTARGLRVERVEFAERKAGWVGKDRPGDAAFRGPISVRAERRYSAEGAPRIASELVELLVGFEVRDIPASTRLLSSKLALPGPEWELVRTDRERLWLLDRDADLAIATRGPGTEHAIVYAWRLRDEGLWLESWRSWLGLESSPFRRGRRRAIVRIAAYAPHDGQLVLEEAKQRLDRFIAAFREELAAL